MERMSQSQVAVVRQGPAVAIEALYRAEFVGMVRLAYTLIGSNPDAEEIVQDSFVEISQRFAELRQPGAYLRSVVVSRCRSALRHRRIPGRPGHLMDQPRLLCNRPTAALPA